jgi:hypothetical protein
MSFFAQLLAGAANGAGRGMAEDIAARERMDAQQQLQAEKLQAAQAMKDGQLETQRYIAELRASQSGGGGKGGSGVDLFSKIYEAQRSGQDVEPLIRTLSAFSGGAADQVRSTFGAAPSGEQVNYPTEQDVLSAISVDNGGAPTMPAQVSSRTMGERLKGEQALQRVYALLSGPENMENFAQGEAALGRNDFGQEAARAALKGGGSALDAGNAFNEMTNSAKQNPLGERYADLKEMQIVATANNNASRVGQSQVSTLQKHLASLMKQKTGSGWLLASDEEKADVEAQIASTSDQLTQAMLMGGSPEARAYASKRSAALATPGGVQDAINKYRQKR